MSACCCFSSPWILDASLSPRNCCLVHLPNAPPVFSYTWSSLLILDCMEMWEWDYSIPFVFLFLISWKKKYFLGCLMLLLGRRFEIPCVGGSSCCQNRYPFHSREAARCGEADGTRPRAPALPRPTASRAAARGSRLRNRSRARRQQGQLFTSPSSSVF